MNDTYINYVKEGSTIIGGSISTTGTTDATSISTTLNSGITGYSIISSSSTIYYGDYPYAPVD